MGGGLAGTNQTTNQISLTTLACSSRWSGLLGVGGGEAGREDLRGISLRICMYICMYVRECMHEYSVGLCSTIHTPNLRATLPMPAQAHLHILWKKEELLWCLALRTRAVDELSTNSPYPPKQRMDMDSYQHAYTCVFPSGDEVL